jgi:carbonic anhydrase/acetyltransferase-like protein (isoleucine patch superfamily)
MREPLIIAVCGRMPQIHPGAWVVPNASVIDQVTLAAPANRHNAGVYERLLELHRVAL